MTSEIFLSIIVPVYKVEKYADVCAASLFQGCLPDIEYIFVDDCSPDQSMQCIRKQAQKYRIPEGQIKFLKNEQNQGLSISRNNGEAVASGKYIWFVDSDDWIADGILSKLIAFLKQNLPEILALNVIHTDAADYSAEYTPYLKNFSGVFDGKKLLQHTLPCAQFYIFEHDFWRKNNFSFYPGIYHEDTELTPKARYLSKRVMAFPEVVYYYRISQGSIVAVPKLKRSLDLLFVAQRLADFMQIHVSEEDRRVFTCIIAVVFTSSFNNAICLDKKEQKLFTEALRKYQHLFLLCKMCSKVTHKMLFTFHYLPVSILLPLYTFMKKHTKKSNGYHKK